MGIRVPRESKAEEKRGAITPSGVAALASHNHTVLIERGAGLGSGITDQDFPQGGGRITAAGGGGGAARRQGEEVEGAAAVRVSLPPAGGRALHVLAPGKRSPADPRVDTPRRD